MAGECPHMASVQYAIVSKKLSDPSTWACDSCDSNTESVWICLTCAHVGCGRTCTQRHAIRHHRDTRHPLALHINQKMLYCYLCKDWALNDNQLGEVELLRSNLGSLQNQVIEKSTTRAGSVIHLSAPVFRFVDRAERHDQSDRTFTARKHFETSICRRVFRAWARISGPSKNRRLFTGRTGLRNIGNTCYQNATLTCLSSLNVVREFIQNLSDLGKSFSKSGESHPLQTLTVSRRPSEQLFEETQCREPPLTPAKLRQSLESTQQLSVLEQLFKLFRLLWSGKWAGITPICFVRTFVSAVPRFRGYQQHDAHEFLMSLLDRVHDELQHMPPVPGTLISPIPENALLVDKDSQESSRLYSGRKSRRTSHEGPDELLSSTQVQFEVIDTSAWLRSFIRVHFQSTQISNTHCHRCSKTSMYAFPGAHAITLDLPFTIERLKRMQRQVTVGVAGSLNRSRRASTMTTTKSTADESRSSRQRDMRRSQRVSSLHLDDLLVDLVAPTYLRDNSRYRCDNCNALTDATKRDQFQYLSTVVVLHINRSSWDEHGKRKMSQRIQFPIKGLNLSVLMSSLPSQSQNPSDGTGSERKRRRSDLPEHSVEEGETTPEPLIYNLRAMVLHHGKEIDQGHYTSLCYDDLIQSWVTFNDIKAKLVSESEVLKPNGDVYLLFYERE